MFEVRNLNADLCQDDRTFPVVRDVSFRIDEGKLLGLIGESGSGKTVTALSIAGVQRPPRWQVRGEVRLDGKDIPLHSEEQMRQLRGREICFVTQNPMSAFDPLFTIRDHFRETQAAHGNESREAGDRMAEELLERMRIADPKKVLKSYPFECSGGMLQRIMIAIAVMNRPKLLIADEPTTALDRTVQYEIIRILGELKEMGSAILFVSHDLKAVSYIADDIAVMYGGYLVEQGPVRSLLESPQHPYTKALIGATPGFSKDPLPVLEGMPPSLQQRPPEGCPFLPRCKGRTTLCDHYGMECITQDHRLVRCAQYKEADHGKTV